MKSLDQHPQREGLIHLAAGDHKLAARFLRDGSVPLHNVLQMLSYYSGLLELFQLHREATNATFDDLERLKENHRPFDENKHKAGIKSKRKKTESFARFSQLVAENKIDLKKSYAANKVKLGKGELRISERTFYNYKQEVNKSTAR